MENKLVFEVSLRFNNRLQKSIAAAITHLFIQTLKGLLRIDRLEINTMLVVYENDIVTRHLGSDKTFSGIEQELQNLQN